MKTKDGLRILRKKPAGDAKREINNGYQEYEGEEAKKKENAYIYEKYTGQKYNGR